MSMVVGFMDTGVCLFVQFAAASQRRLRDLCQTCACVSNKITDKLWRSCDAFF